MTDVAILRPRRALLGLLGLWIACASTAPAADLPSEKALPPNTLGYAKMANAAQFRQALKASAIGQLINDEAMKPMKEEFLASLQRGETDLREKLGISYGELLALPQGPLMIAVIPKDDPKYPTAVLAVIDAGANADKLEEVLNRATAEAVKENRKELTETFKDIKLHILDSIKEGEDKETPVIWARNANIFHLASDLDALKDLITHAAGRTDSIADSEAHAIVAKRLGTANQTHLFVNLEQLWKTTVSQSANQGANAEQIEAQLQLTGLNGLKAIGGAINFSTDDYDSETKLFAYAPGPVQGLLKLFTLPRTDLKPEPWVPASVSSYAAYHWDLDAMWDGLNELADQFAPGVLANLEQQLSGEQAEPISFKKDIFGPLGNRITVLSDYKKPVSEKSQRLLVAVNLEDPKTFQASLNKIIEIAQAKPTKRDFQGVTIYDFPLPEMPPDANFPYPGPISLAISKDHVFVGTEPSILEMVLRPGNPPLADSPEYQAVAKKLPAQASILTFEKSEDNARVFYDMVKSGQLSKSIEDANAAAGVEAPKMDFDTSKIPDFSVFAKYLNILQGGYAEQLEDGLYAIQFALKKANP